MTDKVDWRDKYRVLALEAGQYERQRGQMLECLRSLVMQFDLAVHGQYPRLDQLLIKLETALHAGQVDAVLELLRQTEKYVRMLDEARMQLAQQLIARIDEWALLLLQTSETQADTLQEVRRQLVDAKDGVRGLSELMDRLLECQRCYRETDIDSADERSRQKASLNRRLAQRLLALVRQFQVRHDRV